MNGTAGAFVFLTGYLIAASFLVSMMVVGSNPIVIGDISGLENNNTDFTQFANTSEINSYIRIGTWNISNTKGVYSTTPLTKNEIHFLDTLVDSEGVYTNSYHIKNPGAIEHGYIVYSQTGFSEIKVRVDDDGFYFLTGPSVDEFYGYPSILDLDEYNITIEFDSINEWCEVTLDDESLTVFSILAHKSSINFFWSWLGYSEVYAGVYAYGADFQILSLSSLFSLTVQESDFSISGLIKTMATVLLWFPPEDVMPQILNMLLIKLPGLGLVFIIVQTLRGTG